MMSTKDSDDLANHIGTLLKNLEERHNIEFKVGFNLHTSTFFNKLVSESLLKKGVRISSDDFYKGLLFLDYFCDVLDNDQKVCDNLVAISKKLRAYEKDKGMDIELSYLDLEPVIVEAGLCAKDRDSVYYDNARADIEQRYKNNEGAVDFSSPSLKKADPYYEAIGLMVCDLISDEAKGLLKDVTSRNELGAIVFSDSVLGVLNDSNHKAQVKAALSKKDYLYASLAALECLRAEANYKMFESFIDEKLKEVK